MASTKVQIDEISHAFHVKLLSLSHFDECPVLY
jgi:hypothetical protein